jgi:hypothetical protein
MQTGLRTWEHQETCLTSPDQGGRILAIRLMILDVRFGLGHSRWSTAPTLRGEARELGGGARTSRHEETEAAQPSANMPDLIYYDEF